MSRAVLYLRQSQTTEDSISLELQQTACETYCKQRGYTIVGVESDPGISGGTFNRPGVTRAMTWIESQHADVIVIWRWSRLSRRNVDWYVALDRVEKAGGRIESATEPVDLSTGVGEFSRDMLISFAAFERKKISEGWKEAHARRVRMGLPQDGLARFGYLKVGKGYVPDPQWGPVVQQLYQRWLAGESALRLTAWLNDLGAPTRWGRGWRPEGLLNMLDTGFSAGLLNYQGLVFPGAHEPLIDQATWRAYQAARIARKPVRRERTSHKHMLSGLLTCHALVEGERCGARLHASGSRKYPPGTLWKCHVCPANNAWMPAIVKILDPWIESLIAGEDEAFETALKTRPAPAGIGPLKRALVKVENDLLRIAQKEDAGFYDPQTYLRLRGDLLDKQRLTQKRLDELTGPPPVDREAVVTALGAWRDLTTRSQDQQHALSQVLRTILVRKNETPKYQIVPKWG